MAMILDALPVNPSYMTRWDPRWKIAAFSITAAIVAFCHSDVSLLSAWLGLSLVLAASRLDWVFVFRRSVYFVAYLTPFVALTLISSFAGTEKLPFRFVLRAIVLFMLAALFVATTRFADVTKALASLGLPRFLIHLLAMCHRFIYLIAEEGQRCELAMRVRGLRATQWHRVSKTYSYVLAALILRAEERAERVATAMQCRGFHGAYRTLAQFHTRSSDVVYFFLFVGVGVLALAVHWSR